MNPLAIAFIPLSSCCHIANSVINPTAIIGVSSTADGGKGQPIKEKTRVSGHSLTTLPQLVDENKSEEDGDNLLASPSTMLTENDKGKKGSDDPVLYADIQTPHEPHTPVINNEYRVLAGKILSTKKGKRKNIDRPQRHLSWLKQSARE